MATDCETGEVIADKCDYVYDAFISCSDTDKDRHLVDKMAEVGYKL